MIFWFFFFFWKVTDQKHRKINFRWDFFNKNIVSHFENSQFPNSQITIGDWEQCSNNIRLQQQTHGDDSFDVNASHYIPRLSVVRQTKKRRRRRPRPSTLKKPNPRKKGRKMKWNAPPIRTDTHIRARMHDSIQFFDSRARLQRRRRRRRWQAGKKSCGKRMRESESVCKRKMNRPEIINVIIIKNRLGRAKETRSVFHHVRTLSRTSLTQTQARNSQWLNTVIDTLASPRHSHPAPTKSNHYVAVVVVFFCFLPFIHSFSLAAQRDADWWQATIVTPTPSPPSPPPTLRMKKKRKLQRNDDDDENAKVLPRRVFGFFHIQQRRFALPLFGDAIRATRFESNQCANSPISSHAVFSTSLYRKTENWWWRRVPAHTDTSGAREIADMPPFNGNPIFCG